MATKSFLICDYCAREEITDNKLKSGWLSLFFSGEAYDFCSVDCLNRYFEEKD